MFRYLWLRPFAHRLFGRRWQRTCSIRPSVSSRRRVRPRLEALEDRITPTTFAPTTFADDGTLNSLRGAITQANLDNGTATDTIQLQAGTYQLTIPNTASKHDALSNARGDLNIVNEKHALIIEGTTDAKGNPTTVINQEVADRVFQIELANSNVTFKNVVIEGGRAQDSGGEGTVAGTTAAEGGGILFEGANLTLINVGLHGDSADAGAGFDALGGGIYVANANGLLDIQSSVLQANGALGGAGNGVTIGGSALGGGIYSIGTTTITDSTLSGNSAKAGDTSAGGELGGDAEGGGIFARKATTITNSILSGNTLTGGASDNGSAGDAQGGSVYASGKLTITGSTLSGNTLTGGKSGNGHGGDAEGGSVFSVAGPLSITGSTLSGNTLTGGNGSLNRDIIINAGLGGDAAGGGVYATASNTATIDTSTLSGNTLTGGNGSYTSGTVHGSIGGAAKGGGFYADSTSKAALTASTLSGNTLTGGNAQGGSATPGTAQGGGAYLGGAGNTLVNTTIAGNQAVGGSSATAPSASSLGGGLYIDGLATATLTNDTVADNKVSLPPGGIGSAIGGGIYNGGTATLVNTLVARNSADASPDYNGKVTNSSHNLIGNADGSGGFSASHGDLLGNTDKPINPHLGSLANNGGPTQTLALLPGSPAFNAGDNSAQSVIGSFDQRGQGFPRVANGTIDIGAFEDQNPPPSSGGGGGGTQTPPSLIQALISLYLDGVELEAFEQAGIAAFKDNFATASLLKGVLQFFGNPDLNTIQANIAFNLPYAAPFGPLVELLGESAVLKAVQSS